MIEMTSVAQDPEKYVEQLLVMFRQFSALVSNAFYDDPRFLTTRDQAFQMVLNDTSVFAINMPQSKSRGCVPSCSGEMFVLVLCCLQCGQSTTGITLSGAAGGVLRLATAQDATVEEDEH